MAYFTGCCFGEEKILMLACVSGAYNYMCILGEAKDMVASLYCDDIIEFPGLSSYPQQICEMQFPYWPSLVTCSFFLFKL